MNKMKKSATLVVMVLVMGLLAACSKPFDASGYTKALLDNYYKNDSTQFVAMEMGTEEEAAEMHAAGLEAQLEVFTNMGIGADITEGYRDVLLDMMAGAKYTVGTAEKLEDDSYIVTITYEKMNVYGPMMESYIAEVMSLAEEWGALPEEELPSEEELYNQVFTIMKECLADAVANATYEEPATTTIRIELVDEVYQPNEEDFVKLVFAFFDIDAVMNQVGQLMGQ